MPDEVLVERRRADRQIAQLMLHTEQQPAVPRAQSPGASQPSSGVGVYAVGAPIQLLWRRRGSPRLNTFIYRLMIERSWSLFQIAVTMPIANHVSGKKTDLSHR